MKILIAGQGSGGKDTAAKYLAEITGLKYAGSCSDVIAPFVAERLGVSAEEAHADRRNNRQLWWEVGEELRTSDPMLLLRTGFSKGDILTGVRGFQEFFAYQSQLNMSIWIENPDVARDETVKICPGDCDVTVVNDGSLSKLYRKLDRLGNLLKGMK